MYFCICSSSIRGTPIKCSLKCAKILMMLILQKQRQAEERETQTKPEQTDKQMKYSSVTRFGKVCHFGEILKMWPFSEGSNSDWPNYVLTLAWFICYLANFHCCEWPNIIQIIQPSGHTAWVCNTNLKAIFNSPNAFWKEIKTHSETCP